MNSYKVSIVNYLNSALFVEGLRNAKDFEITIELDSPAESASKLLTNKVDIALAPVAIIPLLDCLHIVSDYCIGSVGEVKTVKIFSDVPIENVTVIYLDYQSKSSVQLVKILCQHKWKINPRLIPAYHGFQKDIYKDNAGLIIGDRAVRALGHYQYEYDLGEEWTAWTGLPFVYAVWLANKEINREWLEKFNEHLKSGLSLKLEIADRYKHLNSDLFSVKDYLNTYISYDFDLKKKEALQHFLSFFSEKG